MYQSQRSGRNDGAGQQAADDTHVGHVDAHRPDTGGTQTFDGQQLGFEIGFQPGMAIDFGAELQRLAGGQRALSAGMQHRAAVAKPGHALAVEQMSVNAGDLGRGVSTQPERAARQLVNQLESLQIQRFAGAGQQRFDVFEQRRHDQLVTITAGGVQKQAAQLFNMARLGGQDIGNLIRQLP